jgi:queuine tRNA-ribosyltransferase
MTAEVAPRLPAAKPRYLMGVGQPEDLADYILRGVDLMDCVLPTRAARHACLYTRAGRLLIKKAQFAEDPRPIEENCACLACRRYSRAYLRHLFQANEILGAVLATHHNLYFYLQQMREIRAAIRAGKLAEYAARVRAQLEPEDATPRA